MTDTRPSPPRPLDAVPSILLAVAFVLTAVAPRAFGPMATLVASLFGVAAMSLWAHYTGRLRLDADLMRTLAAPAVAVLWLGLCAVLAASPRISWSGIVGQHTGWALWFALLGLLGLAAASSRGADARRIVATTALLGGIAGLAIVWDRLVGFADRSYSRAPSGFFENSLSAGQFLLIGLGCAVGWYALSRRTGGVSSVAAIVAIAANLAGLALADSRAAYAAAIAGLVVWAVVFAGVRLGKDLRDWTRRLVVALLITALVGVALLSAASMGLLGDSVEGAWSRVANDRDEIWDSAILVAGQDLLTGRGPDQFSAWSSWDFPEEGGLKYQGTYDPHDILLSWLIAGGLPGLLLFLGAGMLVAYRVADAVVASRGSLATTAPIAGLAAWGVSLLFAWVNPLAAVAGTLVTGALWGATRERDPDAHQDRGVSLTVGWALAVGAFACAALLIPPAAAELSFAQANTEGDALDTATISYLRWPDPVFATAAATAGSRLALSPAELDPERIIVPAQDARWDVNIALVAALSTQQPGASGEDEAWVRYTQAMDAGRIADPGSSIWVALTALEASRRGLDEIAEPLASDAVSLGLPPGAATLFEERYPELE